MKSLLKIKNLHHKSLHQQRGLTLISWCFVLIILAFCGMFVFRVVPMYAENTYVVKALKSLVEPGARVMEMSDGEIKKKLFNYYLVNNIRTEGPKNIIIDRKTKALLVTIDYESRTNLFWNIDIVVSFQNHLDGEQPALCCKPLAEKRATKY